MTEIAHQFRIQRFSAVSLLDRARILDQVISLEKEVWPEEIQAPREKFEARAEIFPEGFLMINDPSGEIVGVSTSEIIDYDPKSPPVSWENTTDNGWTRGTHNPKGNALYLVSVGARSGMGVGTRLVEEQITLAKKLNLSYLVLGSRIPGYHKYHIEHPRTTIKEYIDMKKDEKDPFDPEIRFYSRCGLKVVKVVPNYMEDDPESENYGTVMVWENSNNLPS